VTVNLPISTAPAEEPAMIDRRLLGYNEVSACAKPGIILKFLTLDLGSFSAVAIFKCEFWLTPVSNNFYYCS
jgi:hypothetical protein